MSPNAWRTVVDIVLNGTFLCWSGPGPSAHPGERDGAIVDMGASYAWTGGPGFAHSAAAKAGVKNLTETLAVEWAPYGIRVNGLVPGLMPHEDETAAIAAVPGKYEGQDSRVPAGRVGFPRELAWAATYLCSPYATYISGHSLVVDGANWQRRHTVQPPFTPIPSSSAARPSASGTRRAHRRTEGSAMSGLTEGPGPGPAGGGRTHRRDHQQPPREAQRHERRDGPAAVGGAGRSASPNELRAIVWRGEGARSPPGRDTTQLGLRVEDISDLEFIERGHRPTQMFLTMPCPIICALKGWVIGGAFERSLLCDIRVAAAGTRMVLPEVVHGVIPDSGGWPGSSRWSDTVWPPTWP